MSYPRIRTYCTLFDRNYIARGLALHHSLMAHARPFYLHILALDVETITILEALELEYVHIIPLADVESRLELAAVRLSRNWMEYCWTLASQLMWYVMLTVKPDILTYLDSDLFFFSEPEPIFTEMAKASIAIVPHRFHRGNMRLAMNGVYNVGWLTIRNDADGMGCLVNWALQCQDWCFHRNEDGKFGDQGYLNSWPLEYGPACAVIQNPGAGLAPWNVMCYDVAREEGMRTIRVTRTLESSEPNAIVYSHALIFYHFHEFTHDGEGNTTRLTRHPHHSEHKRLIYAPYSNVIKEMAQQLKMKEWAKLQ